MLDLWRSGDITEWQLMGAEWLYDFDQQRSEFNCGALLIAAIR